MISSKPAQGQTLAFGALGLLTLLTAGAAAWSGLTSPNNVDVQLHVAAANTVAARSLVVEAKINIDLAIAGQETLASANETIDYQSPDRVLITESDTSSQAGSPAPVEKGEETQIGPSCWLSGSTASSPCNPQGISELLATVRDLENSSGAALRDGTYYVSHSESEAIFNEGASQGAGGAGIPASDYSVEARIHGDLISWEHLSLYSNRQTEILREEIDLTFKDVGSAPPVIHPAGPPTKTG